MRRIRGAIACFQLAVKRPIDAWEVLCALPTLVFQNILFCKPILYVRRHAGIGDIVCTFPSLGALKQRHPKSIIIYETRLSNLTLVRRCRHVDLAIKEESLLAILLNKFFKPTMIFYPLLPDERYPPQPRDRIHAIREFSKSFGLESLSETLAQLEISARALRQVKQRLRHENLHEKAFVVIHTGPTWKVKEWPQKNWCELVAKLKMQLDFAVIQIGEDQTANGEIRESPQVDAARNWIGSLTMDQTLALLSLADLVVGIDSGVLHLAGAVTTPCVGIFGPTNAASYLPQSSRAVGVTSNVSCLGCHHDSLGPQHWRNGCTNNIRCMSELSAEDVFDACIHILHLPEPK